MLTYVLAVLAACANAVSSVLQRKANKRVPQRENMSLRQIWTLLHQPVWFGGILAITAGFLLQASALGTGQLAVVEPVLVLELPFTLILASRLFRQRLGPREWLPAAAMTAAVGQRSSGAEASARTATATSPFAHGALSGTVGAGKAPARTRLALAAGVGSVNRRLPLSTSQRSTPAPNTSARAS